MSRIDDLIRHQCPDGVDVKALGEVGHFVRGNGLQKRDFTETGFPCIHYGQIYTFYGTSTASTRSFVAPELAATLRKARPGDLVVTTTSENVDDVCKAVAWLGEGEVAIGGHSCVFTHSLDPLYAAYYFQTDAFYRQKRRYAKGTKVKELSGHDLARITLPVPPLAIQRAIVAILTRMEWLETDLESELESELEARWQQYAHYRDTLFAQCDGASAERVTMGEVGEFIRGRRFTKGDVTEVGVASIHYGEIYTGYGVYADRALSHVRSDLAPTLRFAQAGDVVIAAVGETVEDVGKAVAWLGGEEVAIHDDCFAFRHAMNPKFVAYYLQTTMFHAEKAKHVARAKVKRISSHGLARIKIPTPSEEEQLRIVDVLDKFDALVHNISIGLPAEVRARRQQYEHYRDRLLTFDRAAG